MKKSIYISIILFTILFIALISIIILINKPNTVSNTERENTLNNNLITNEFTNNYENTIISVNSSNIKLSPNCKITFTKHYTTCGHNIKNTERISNDLVNLTLEDFSKLYSNWTISKFTSADVELSKNISDYCGEHYLAKDLDGYIAIYSIDPLNNSHMLKKTEILTKYLTEGDRKNLSSGVTIFGKDNLNSFLEDFE